MGFFERGGACVGGRGGRSRAFTPGSDVSASCAGESLRSEGRLPLPLPCGRGGAFRVPRSSRRAGAGGGRGVAVVVPAAAAGGSRLSLCSGVGDGGVEAAASARQSVSRR